MSKGSQRKPLTLKKEDMKLKLDSFQRKHFIWFFSIFLLIFLFGIAISFACPSSTRQITQVKKKNQKGTILIKDSTGELESLNQEVFFNVIIENKLDKKIDEELLFNVTLQGYNPKKKKWDTIDRYGLKKKTISCSPKSDCKPVNLIDIPFIIYYNYSMNIEVLPSKNQNFFTQLNYEILYMNTNFTIFELFVRYMFLILTFTLIIIYTNIMKKIQWSYFSTEQKLMYLSLILQILFNNPLFPLTILVRNYSFIVIDMLFISFQFTGLMFLSIYLLDCYQHPKHSRKFSKFYLPKIIFSSILFICFSVVLIWPQTHNLEDEKYSSVDSIPLYLFFIVISIICFILYLIYFCFIGFNGYTNIHSQKTRKRLYFMFWFTLLLLLFLGIIFLSGMLRKINGSTQLFLIIFITFNTFNVFLLFLILPSNSVLRKINRGYIFLPPHKYEPIAPYTQDPENEPIIEELSIDESEEKKY
ncbi:transmembrane protein [Anaeramoeba flamelloides]|uniref:Transmembrane protein n=1 Tax=Anaeramoeba flamelloides TaxID=1746091 RepID=A0ABQ8YL06_9EUKA|nr:transmembrane protein [Anaeramoeba flamelloides]